LTTLATSVTVCPGVTAPGELPSAVRFIPHKSDVTISRLLLVLLSNSGPPMRARKRSTAAPGFAPVAIRRLRRIEALELTLAMGGLGAATL
jgi:hypothetical protein